LAQEPAPTRPASDDVRHRGHLAIADIFPIIKSVRAWTAGINDTLAALQLTPREHEDILIAAAELVGRLTDSCNPTSRSNERHTDPEQHQKARKRPVGAGRI
jgi:hypothetical protein